MSDGETNPGSQPAPPPPKAGRLDPGDAFGMRYTILQELGAGGMGVVYKAWDEVLGVVVALKMILAGDHVDAATLADIERRFKRELLLARQVTHKNVVRIHDLGDVGGTKYITMTFVDGEDLATALRRARALSVPRVMRLARQIASGLEAAHDAGVVHRDLKPANIMIDAEDHALIMDFGIAQSARARPAPAAGRAPTQPAVSATGRAALSEADATMLASIADETMLGVPARDTSAETIGKTAGQTAGQTAGEIAGPTTASDDGETRLGTPNGGLLSPPSGGGSRPPSGASGSGSAADSVTIGQVVGTLDYMSPEQSRGLAVDQRTDIYAFGLILTDLLLGKRKRPGGMTSWAAMTARISQPPEPLATRDPGVPAPLDGVITKCVQLDPNERYATTGELVAALSRLDDDGNLIPEPVVKRFTPMMMASAGLLLVGLVGGTWWLASGNEPVDHKPVSVLIADFTNSSNDPVFSGPVEQALSVGIEGASFISAFPHRDAMRAVAEIKAGPTLDDNAARLVAMREGLNVIVGGSIAAKGAGYVISVKATNVGDQKLLLDWSTTAVNKDDVFAAVGRAAERIRRTLGDTNTANASSEQETFTATSLEAAKAYSEAQDLQWAGKFDDAIAGYRRTIQIDPNFGRAHAGLAALYANQTRTEDADASYNRALKLLDRMTEREKLRTRGGYYLFKRNYAKAIEESDALLKKYPADTSGMANLAVAQFYKRDMKTALAVGRRASDVYPNNVVRKNNVALFAMYAGDFDEARRLAGKVLELNPTFPKAFVALGVSQLAQGQSAEASATFARLGEINASAAKDFALTAQIDQALAETRDADALKLLGSAIASDREAKNTSSLGRRLAVRAGVLVARGDKAGALRDAREAITLGTHESILYPAGRALIDAGQPAAAIELAAELDNRLENEPRLYGALLRGEAALAAGRARAALNAFEDAQKLGDSWMGRLSLGRAYLALKAFPEASAEFDRCLSRRGEATSIFLDDRPTYHVFNEVAALVQRAKTGLGGK